MVISDAPLRPTFELRPQKIFAAITPMFELKLLLGGALKNYNQDETRLRNGIASEGVVCLRGRRKSAFGPYEGYSKIEGVAHDEAIFVSTICIS